MRRRKLAPAAYLQNTQTHHGELWSHALLLERLTKTLHSILPTPISEHCIVANLHDRELVVGTDSPVWAARFRYYSPQVMKRFAKLPNIKVRSIRTRVLPTSVPVASAPVHPRKLSAGAGEVLTQSARTITDKHLRNALLRLATRARQAKTRIG